MDSRKVWNCRPRARVGGASGWSGICIVGAGLSATAWDEDAEYVISSDLTSRNKLISAPIHHGQTIDTRTTTRLLCQAVP